MDRGAWLVETSSDAETLSAAALLKLQTWFSPAFPVGAYSYSHGLEWAVEAGEVHSAPLLRDWVAGVLRHGSGRNDGILLHATWAAVARGDGPAATAIRELAAALQPSAERRVESLAQGDAFLAAVEAAWPCGALSRFRVAAGDTAMALPVAVGAAAAAHGLPLFATLVAYLHACAANLVGAGVRLVPLGQTDGLRVLAALEPLVLDVAHDAGHATLDDLGSAGWLADIASMRHETQYSRLFRS